MITTTFTVDATKDAPTNEVVANGITIVVVPDHQSKTILVPADPDLLGPGHLSSRKLVKSKNVRLSRMHHHLDHQAAVEVKIICTEEASKRI